jgi:hypothetical protein
MPSETEEKDTTTVVPDTVEDTASVTETDEKDLDTVVPNAVEDTEPVMETDETDARPDNPDTVEDKEPATETDEKDMTTVLPEETEKKDPTTVSAEEKETTTVVQDPVEDGNPAIVSTEEKDVVPDTAEDKEPVNEAAEDAAAPIRNPDEPTAEELVTLPRVPGRLSFVTLTIAIVETCERISFCGQIAVFQNFIQQSLPEGSPTGAGGHKSVSGALGLGQKVATSISTGMCRCCRGSDTGRGFSLDVIS